MQLLNEYEKELHTQCAVQFMTARMAAVSALPLPPSGPQQFVEAAFIWADAFITAHRERYGVATDTAAVRCVDVADAVIAICDSLKDIGNVEKFATACAFTERLRGTV